MPTIRRCCIVGCLSNSRQQPQLQFFQFPRPENPFHRIWKQACHASLARILPFKKPVVCALHFESNCIGGRRLTSSAVPTLRLEVPSNLKAVEQQAMMEEIERSRKCAYINAVVYEWLVRANLNPQLRGSITHGMIKEKADTAKNLIGSTTFVADNRWLNRFRETHLTGFAQKLATNQLKPLGSSLWIPDIVQDLAHLFPPTNSETNNDFENVPKQYIDYMQQYGEYDDEDDNDQSSSNSMMNTPKDQSYQQQQQQTHYQQQQHYQQHNNNSGYDAYGHHQNYSGYDDYYHSPLQQQHTHYQHQQQQQQQQHHNYPTPSPPATQRPQSHSPPQQQTQSYRASPYDNSNSMPSKRIKMQYDDDQAISNSNSSPHNETIENLTNEQEDEVKNVNGNSNNNSNSNESHANSKTSENGDVTPKCQSTPSPKTVNGQTNGHSSPPSPNSDKALESYEQALEYLKPLEDFVLFRENFRAIGLVSQLEEVLRKGNRLHKINLKAE